MITRDLMASIIIALIRNGVIPNNRDVKEYIDSTSADDLRGLLGQHRELASVASYIGSKSGSQAQGVLSEMYSVVRDVFTGVFADAGDFSMRKFIRQKQGRTAFIEYDLAIGDVLSPIYTLLFDLALKEALGRTATQGNVYLIADELKLLPNLRHLEDGSTISVMAYSGGKWVESENSVQANTYSPCAIDKSRTELTEETITTPKGTVYSVELKIRLSQGIPNNVAGFYYAVRTTSSASRWATVEEIGKVHDIGKVSIKKYKEKDGIIYSESVTDERTFYISVFTIYDVGGNEVISEPKTIKVDRTISADLFWKVSKGFLGSLKLTISAVGNRPIEHVPELVLCGCNDGEFITNNNDPKAVEFIRINAVDLEKPQKEYSQSYDLAKDNYRKNMKFFLFEANPVRSEKFTLRWFQGFTGKV